MRVLLLSAYDAVSHRYWREGLVENFPEYDWTVLALPPRYFSWRVRGNSLSWGFGEREILHRDYDLVVATSMVDLSALRGFVPKLATVPTLLYFHENQFVYPESQAQTESEVRPLDAQMLSLYSALCAERLLFNTAYNRDTFFQGLAQLLKKLPDAVPKQLLESLQARAQVLPVPLNMELLKQGPTHFENSECFNVVWNHRWEYDKNPEALFKLVQSLPADLKLCWHIIGQQFRYSPKVFDALHDLLQQRAWLGAWGFVKDRQEYLQLLKRGHLVLSTALHDFQGIAVQEGVAAGCVPIVPQRLAYPELFDPKFCYEEGSLFDKFLGFYQAWQQGSLQVPSVYSFTWQNLRVRYQEVFDELVS